MLDFFRRYQRYFFFVITVVIIISFSFFGTYSTLGTNSWREQVAFKAVDGKEITRAEVDEMAIFLATDNEDKRLYNGVWGPNFLNDGVIRKDFLETGLAQELVEAYQNEMKDPLNKRLEKEKKFTLYTHPQAPFLSVENAWGYFSPEMNEHFKILQSTHDNVSPKAFDSRVKLFLAEKKFSPAMLRQVLRYQEKQYNWLTPDQELDRINLSLFGYHTLEDWFTPYFTRLVSEFIINTALLAEQQGYEVTKSEAIADLIRNTQISYQQNQNNPSIGVPSPEEYFNEQLRLLNMDQARAIKVWRQVLLFRRYFQDAGHSALVDTLAYQVFNNYSYESVTVDLYRLPAALKFANYDSLQKFEVYLNIIGKGDRKDSLSLPEEFLDVVEVERVYPELVQKRYELEVAQVSQKVLQARIGIKELWSWEVDDKNWEILKVQFPDLALRKAITREERFSVLDDLDKTTRSKVDRFAKEAIVRSHPEWILEGLSKVNSQKMNVGLRTTGGKIPFTGLDKKEKRQEFMQLLDHAILGEAPTGDLKAYTADNQNYYQIKVLNRAPQSEILTFEEANQDGTMDEVRMKALEKYYLAIREQSPSTYQKENQEWKSFKSVREIVAGDYFSKVLITLQPAQKTLLASEKEPANWSKDQAASLRLYSYVQQIKAKLEKDPSLASLYVKNQELEQKPVSLKDQWLLERTNVSLTRQDQKDGINTEEAFILPVTAWSNLSTPVNGDLAFFQVKEKGEDVSKKEVAIAEQTKKAQAILSIDVQKVLMHHILDKIKAKDAISLSYLQVSQETSTDESALANPDF
ncbi:SurA N-terminal domain-containing protein [Candidatus Protochlamydia sp. R18]|uniref:SurA N-terminal domain-containing protein n=1 Tax=Candidatus Protochlamydia sp. R18 TaxID=1353977 RepID=UPI0005A790E4|nr:SurA N-terminal domain-containing protein [Candidatus Protochlamydia sp. R18]